MNDIFNIESLVIGGGVVGLAVAYRLSCEGKKVLILEKNESWGEETSSRNSSVIHSGIYYPEDSLKSKLCVDGRKQLYEFCEKYKVSYRKLGKLIVAINREELEVLEGILNQGRKNGVEDLEWWNKSKLNEMEPNLRAEMALYSPSTGILDVFSYMQTLLTLGINNGVEGVLNTKVLSISQESRGYRVEALSCGEKCLFNAETVVVSAGLHASELIFKELDKTLYPKMKLCRGHYVSYSGKSPFKHLIYPVPDPLGAGLGVHSTIEMDGTIKFGPDVEYIDRIDYSVPDHIIPKFYDEIKKYFPSANKDKFNLGYAGIRPKAYWSENEKFSDFSILGPKDTGLPNCVQLFGIESPGLTSSLSIADYVLELLEVA